MGNSESSKRRQLLAEELKGKHFAAQQYDERIWKIRTGFLTLVFAAWGALLAASQGNILVLRSVAIPLVVITGALALSGGVVDYFYVTRKMRCIQMINQITRWLFENADDTAHATKHEDAWLRFSGDDPKISAYVTGGYGVSITESVLIYLLPTASIVIAYLLLPQQAS